MNCLNSILLEGNLIADPVQLDDQTVSFAIESVRFSKVGDELEKEAGTFTVKVTIKRLADTCFKVLKEGRGVRVVGRLAQSTILDAQGNPVTSIDIIAEHVEFKPVFMKEEAKAS